MKTLIKIFFYYSFAFVMVLNAKESLSLGNEVKEYDKIFEKIAEKRDGIEISKLEQLQNPFVVIGGSSGGINGDGNGSIATPSYVLEATLDQKAKINGKWFSKRDTVDIYTLVRVNHNSIILQNESEKKEIFIRTKDDTNIKILSK